ncbi:ribulokinase [Tichowtungia aerotolerans]|uniref:Ribulokinase n=1 Tax=Tichowtungia aerotolerans TaxID=2697043 RepID=A0A6P1M3J9_9BACT|nr:ribulokinase [Tichowtungia aerotolerans]QHI69419.1 ribulokinase [Tichowtungia aerotolerans]
MNRYALGLDYGTESVRALIVDCETGAEIAEATYTYAHGVMTDTLPGSGQKLPPEFALQCPADYRNGALTVIREVLKAVDGDQIIGIGIDFTACTVLPIKQDGTPLCELDKFKDNPQAWVKLWKHHAAQPQADRVNEIAHARGEKFLDYYSGIISSEWLIPKCWETLEKAPEVYEAADLFIEAGDWIIQQITGSFSRNACAAGYKGLWSEELGNPSEEFLTALDPKLAGLNGKIIDRIVAAGEEAGVVSEAFAAESGLKAGTPVSAAIIDAHSGVPGMGVSDAGPLCMIMGTSGCHMLPSNDLHLFNGYAGVVKDGIMPGFYGYESGQAAVGDIYGWFAKTFMETPILEIESKAAELKPGESGLVALDWMNGNRSVLMNTNLSGTILGLTLASKPEEVYRALIEATAFGTKIIVDSYLDNNVPVTELVACGGLIRFDLVMQTFADVLELPVKTAASGQAVALGSAIFGAVAAGSSRGGFDTVTEAVEKMTQPFTRTFTPNPEASNVYRELFSIYKRCHDFFGQEEPQLMKKLKQIKSRS